MNFGPQFPKRNTISLVASYAYTSLKTSVVKIVETLARLDRTNLRDAVLAIRRSLGECLTQVFSISDVVTLEHRRRFMPGDFHRDRLSHSSPNHIPRSRASQVVEEPAYILHGFPTV